MKKVLITGGSGFVGNHLINHLSSQGEYEISATTRGEAFKSNKANFLQLDLQNKDAVKSVLEKTAPDWIFHLAAQANVPQSIKNPAETFHANIDSQINLFDSLRELEMLQSKVLLVSSGEVYGYVRPGDLPVDENTPHRPANPYAVSKIAQDYLGLQYFISYKMPIVRVRPFNHVGPGQATTFVVSDFAKQVAEIEKGIKEPLMRVGNMEAKRDFTDVRDMVELYPLLLEKGELGEVYNAGTGVSHSAQEVLDLLFSSSSVKINVESDPAKMRPSDVPEIVADASKVKAVTGWEPKVPFEKTIKDTLDYWRENI